MKTLTKSSTEISATELQLFTALGVELPDEPNNKGQFQCDCPFCDKVRHFFVTPKSKKFKDGGAAFQCKSCGLQGNKYTFLNRLYEMFLEKTSKHSYQRLGFKRKKFNPEAFKEAGVVYNLFTQCWMIPTFDIKKSITNIHSYNGAEGSPLYSAPTCNLHLWGLETLQADGPVFICEGHWDAISLRWLLKQCTKQDDNLTVLAVPGAGNFPDNDLKHLNARDIFLLYDNDKPGHDGMVSACKKLASAAKTIQVITWPPNRFEEGYDLSDLIRESKIRPEDTFTELLSWCHPVEGADIQADIPKVPVLKRDKIEQVIADYKETGIHVYPGFRDALLISLAVIESIKYKGEPLWMYLIGVSGAGKSLILESTLASPNCLYRTAITHRSFVSGFKAEEGVDPSLLAHLPGKALVVKDYSNVLSLPHYEQDQLFSLLREAYDGKVIRGYGNHVLRQYPPVGSSFDDCRFSFVAGVTPDIYNRDNTALGERFLRYHIPRTLGDDLRAIETALDDSWRSHQRATHRAASVSGFLARYDHFPPGKEHPEATIPEWYRLRLVAMSQWVGYCRSHVSRTKEDLDYEPAVESGTRMAKQLKKLSISLARIMGKTACDAEVYRLVRKVAWDTAHGKRRILYRHIYEAGEGECYSLAKTTGISSSTVYRQLRDMHALGLLRKGSLDKSAEGRPKQMYHLSERAKAIFETAKIGEFK